METINIGIDLGTTNSAIAVVKNGTSEIIKNVLGEEFTPSVVYFDRNRNVIVGSKAKRNINTSLKNLQNSKTEIKRLMGTSESFFFSNLNQKLLPEQISAEILKSLIKDVQRKNLNISLEAAIITVPAYFSTVQSEATKRAGVLAGFKQVVLLQEPIAAAIAYGFLNQKNENWLVYDLGGGTFDVALVSFRDGSLTVLAHAGDNFLGGKDFDSAIIQNIIIPFFTEKGIQLDPIVHSQIFSILKELAESAKIELTVSEKTTIDIDIQVNEEYIQHSIEISRSDLLEACKHLLNKTVDLCQKTIKDSKVDSTTVRKVVLVGGPTQMPILQHFLEDTLQIQVDGSSDPLTVVAKGAAMFGNQTTIITDITEQNNTNLSNVSCQLEVNYNPVMSDDEQVVTGKVLDVKDSIHPHSIQFVSSDDSFNSEEILIKNNKFILTLPTGEKGTQYWIYVKDKKGQLISSTPETIHINQGISIMGAPLPYSIGVSVISLLSQKGYADAIERVESFFTKDSILPLKRTKRFHTVADVKAGASENVLPICLYEGESRDPTRNTLVCKLEITGKTLSKDLKKGVPVDITVEINESREVSVLAYLPDVDVSLNARATLYFDTVEIDKVKKDFIEQESRSKSILDVSEEENENESIREQIEDLRSNIESSGNDSDKKRKSEKQLKDLMISLDKVENKTNFDSNVTKFKELSKEISEYIESITQVKKKTDFEATYEQLIKDGNAAISKQDATWLQHITEKLDSFYTKCLREDPDILSSWIKHIIDKNKDKNRSNPNFIKIVQKADECIKKRQVDEMQEVLSTLLEYNDDKMQSIKLMVRSGITL